MMPPFGPGTARRQWPQRRARNLTPRPAGRRPFHRTGSISHDRITATISHTCRGGGADRAKGPPQPRSWARRHRRRFTTNRVITREDTREAPVAGRRGAGRGVGGGTGGPGRAGAGAPGDLVTPEYAGFPVYPP